MRKLIPVVSVLATVALVGRPAVAQSSHSFPHPAHLTHVVNHFGHGIVVPFVCDTEGEPGDQLAARFVNANGHTASLYIQSAEDGPFDLDDSPGGWFAGAEGQVFNSFSMQVNGPCIEGIGPVIVVNFNGGSSVVADCTSGTVGRVGAGGWYPVSWTRQQLGIPAGAVIDSIGVTMSSDDTLRSFLYDHFTLNGRILAKDLRDGTLFDCPLGIFED